MSPTVFYPPQPVEHIERAVYFGGVMYESQRWIHQAAQHLAPLLEQGFALFLPRNPYGLDTYHASMSLRMEWNKQYLEQAAQKGVVALWIPQQNIFRPTQNEHDILIEHPRYAYNALVELQEAFIRHREYDLPLTVGVDPKSPHAQAIAWRFARFCPNVRVHSTLENTCEDALYLASKL